MKPVAALTLAVCASITYAQTLTDLKVEKVEGGFRFTEGPVWARENYLLFSDAPSGKILKWIPGERAAPFRDNAAGASGNGFDGQGRLYTCESRARRVTRTNKKGEVEVLAERFEGKRLNAPNGIVVRRDGNAFFTDPAFGYQSDTRELDFYGVYHLNPKGQLSLIARPAGRPNGIALSPNGRILYVSNADERNVRAYDVGRNNEISGERVLISGLDAPAGGIAVDEKGNLYVAAATVRVFTPRGKQLGTISFPELASNCGFGDADLLGLYVTAQTSVYRVRLDVKGSEPH